MYAGRIDFPMGNEFEISEMRLKTIDDRLELLLTILKTVGKKIPNMRSAILRTTVSASFVRISNLSDDRESRELLTVLSMCCLRRVWVSTMIFVIALLVK